MRLSVPVPPDFNFWRTVCSHGWCTLLPFEVDRETAVLKRPFELSDGRVLPVELSQPAGRRLTLTLPGVRSFGKAARRELIGQVRSCLRLDEDYAGFFSAAISRPRFRWVAATGAGRLLRAPTVFEDVIKMICTTNCSWALTQAMVRNLCTALGSPAGNGSFTFPSPAALAATNERFLRKRIRAGYRAPYLLELSRRAVSGELDLEEWRRSRLPVNDLYDQVRSVKGVGPYAAGNILKLLVQEAVCRDSSEGAEHQ
jgi:3-methyladenine DNA glycosylase/8-oxoguanine DNA glycosylase